MEHSFADDEGYDGPAVVTVAGTEIPVEVRVRGSFQPIDGAFDVFVMRGRSKRDVMARLLKRQLRLTGDDAGTLVVRGRRVSVARGRRSRDELVLLPHRLPVVVMPEAARALREHVGNTRGEAA